MATWKAKAAAVEGDRRERGLHTQHTGGREEESRASERRDMQLHCLFARRLVCCVCLFVSDLPLFVMGEHSEGNILGKERPPSNLHEHTKRDRDTHD